MPPRHLVAIWNPSYAADAMQEHLRILVDAAERYRRAEIERDDVYVWWARLRSGNRIRPLPHLDDVLALRKQIDEQTETHLYLTDYRSLYVADLADITIDPPEGGDLERLPEYLRDKPADLYFRLWDIRRLVADDTVATVTELRQLQNVRYDHRPVSLYGGMVDLPLIVERPDPRLWFSDDGMLTDEQLWAQHDAALRSETDRIGRDLRENLFGDDVWSAFEAGTRAFLATAEALFRSRREDPVFDFAPVAVEYAKAVEVEVNALIFPAIRRVYSKGNPQGRRTIIDGQPADLGEAVPHQTLGALITTLQHNEDVRRGIRAVFGDTDASTIIGLIPHHLDPLAKRRNPAAHSARLDFRTISELRADIVGIGREGLLNQLARLKLRSSRT